MNTNHLCPKCFVPCKGDNCPKCGRKVTSDSIEPRREKDLVDLMPKNVIELRGLTIAQALEIQTNGSCGD
jgi:hypothetical protein